MAGMAASCESELVVMVRIIPYIVKVRSPMLGIKVTQLGSHARNWGHAIGVTQLGSNWGQVLHPGIPVKLTQRK